MSDDKNDGVRVLPLRRCCPDDVEDIGVAPTFMEIHSSRTRIGKGGRVECQCPKCGVYFSELVPHTMELCEVAQIMGE
jgi:hypothetical protein